MTTTRYAENLLQYKCRFSLIVEQIRLFSSSTNFVRKAKNLSPSCKRISQIKLKIILIRIDNPFYRKNLTSSAKNNVQIACAQLIKLTFPYN